MSIFRKNAGTFPNFCLHEGRNGCSRCVLPMKFTVKEVLAFGFYVETSLELLMFTREAVDVQTTAASNLTSWDAKIAKAFFRGRDSKKERLELVRLSKKHPDLLDAGFTNYFFFRKGEEQELGKAERVPMTDFHKFKYQINMDGTVAAYRFVRASYFQTALFLIIHSVSNKRTYILRGLSNQIMELTDNFKNI